MITVNHPKKKITIMFCNIITIAHNYIKVIFFFWWFYHNALALDWNLYCFFIVIHYYYIFFFFSCWCESQDSDVKGYPLHYVPDEHALSATQRVDSLRFTSG